MGTRTARTPAELPQATTRAPGGVWASRPEKAWVTGRGYRPGIEAYGTPAGRLLPMISLARCILRRCRRCARFGIQAHAGAPVEGTVSVLTLDADSLAPS
jgi:hypothetical protein